MTFTRIPERGLRGRPMHQIVFTSRASDYFTRQQIRALCEQAAERNNASAITGLLLYDGCRFISAIEGVKEIVASTMTRIARDRRHFDVIIVRDERVGDRQFSEWAMSQKLLDDRMSTDAFVGVIKRHVANVKDVGLQAQMIGFARLAKHVRYREG